MHGLVKYRPRSDDVCLDDVDDDNNKYNAVARVQHDIDSRARLDDKLVAIGLHHEYSTSDQYRGHDHHHSRPDYLSHHYSHNHHSSRLDDHHNSGPDDHHHVDDRGHHEHIQ